LKKHNERSWILSAKEYRLLLSHCPEHTVRIVKMAYYTAMRQGEIVNLIWDRVNLDQGFISLKPQDTKFNEGRTIPLHPEVSAILRLLPRTIHGRVFTRHGKPLADIKKSFRKACRSTGIEDFRFHDLRHICINSSRLQGHDFLRIMAAIGHRTMDVFKS
jgi:integrase